MKYICFFILIFTLFSCEKLQEGYNFSDKQSFKVEILQINDTNPENETYEIPKLDKNILKVKLKVSLMDYEQKNVLSDNTLMSDSITIKVSNGDIAQKKEGSIYLDRHLKVTEVFNDGIAEFEFYLVNSHDEVYITIEDENNEILGVSSQAINLKNLTIKDIQEPRNENSQSSSYYYNFIRVKKNKNQNNLLVLHASGSGMYVIDTENINIDFPNENNSGACMVRRNGRLVKNPNFVGYNTVYIYSRNAPYNFVGALDISFDFIKSGHRLSWFAGNLVEFPPSVSNGMTELSFPTWGLDDSEFTLDEDYLKQRLNLIPVCDLESSDFPYNDENIKNLEKYESNLVRIKNVTIGDFSPDDKEYKRFHQWSVYPGGDNTNTISVSSADAAGDFDRIFLTKKEYFSGKTLASVTGILHQVYGNIWVVYPRNKCDIKINMDSDPNSDWSKAAQAWNNDCPEVCGDNINDNIDCK